MNRHTLMFLLTFLLFITTSCLGDQLDAGSSNNRILGDILKTFGVSDQEPYTISQPSILTLKDGGFFVAWHSGTDTGIANAGPKRYEYNLYGRIYDPNAPRTAKIKLSDKAYYTNPGRPMLAQFSDSNIFIYWWSDITGQTLDANGNKELYRCIIKGDGETYESAHSVYLGPSVYSQLMIPLTDGTAAIGLNGVVLKSDLTRASFTAISGLTWGNTAQSVVVLTSGGFMTFFTSGGTIYGQIYSSTGTVGTRFQVSSSGTGTKANTTPSVAKLSSGKIAVAWTTQTIGSTRTANGIIVAQNGNTIGTEFSIGSILDNSQLYVLAYPNGKYFMGWDEQSSSSLTLKGNLYDTDYTVKYSQLTVFTQSGSYSPPLSMSVLPDGNSVTAFYDYDTQYVYALKFTPTQSTTTGGSGPGSSSSSSTNIGLIVGVTIAVVIVACIIGYIGIRIYRKRRALNNSRIHAPEQMQVNCDKEKLNISPQIEIINPGQSLAPNQAQMPRSRNADIEDRMISSQQNNMNFAPGLEDPAAQQHIMDGRLAKPHMHGSQQPSIDRNPRNRPSVVNLNLNQQNHGHGPSGEDLQFGPQIGPAQMKSFVMDGRLAKAELLDPRFQQQQQQKNQFEAPQQFDLDAPNVYNIEEKEPLTKSKKKEGDNPVEEHKEEEKNENEGKDKMCVVCLAQPSVMVFLDCMHICACQECTNDIRSAKNMCPICREVIRDAKRVYAI